MSPEFLNAIADYMMSTEKVCTAASRKIASLQERNKELAMGSRALSDSMASLVAKMASAGIIDNLHAAHLATFAKKSVKDSLDKLNALLDDKATTKIAEAPQLYEVDETSNNINNNAEFDSTWMSKLTHLGRKA